MPHRKDAVEGGQRKEGRTEARSITTDSSETDRCHSTFSAHTHIHIHTHTRESHHRKIKVVMSILTGVRELAGKKANDLCFQ